MDNRNITLPIMQLEARMKRALIGLPQVMGNEALNFALDNFKKQGFQDSGFQKWRQRKDPTKWGPVKRPGRALLVDTARLRNSGRVFSLTPEQVGLIWDVPYAKTHNEGLSIGQIQTVKGFTKKSGQNVKAHTRKINQKIHKRQFIGESTILRQLVLRHGTAHIMRYIKR